MAKKVKLKYTDRAIYVDKFSLTGEGDVNLVYRYLYEIALMLSKKRKFFNSNYYYVNFAYYMANLTYMRIISPRINLPKDDPHYAPRLKSCLNYMKKLLYAKKCAFSREEFNFVTKPGDAGIEETFRAFSRERAYNYNRDLMKIDVSSLLRSIGKEISSEIDSGWYGKDRKLSYNLKLSVALTLLKSFTLSRKNRAKLISSKATKNSTDGRVIYKSNYDALLEDAIKREEARSITTFELDSSYGDYVGFIAQKIKVDLVKNINNLIADYELSEDLISDIVSLGVLTPEGSE